MTVRDVLKRLRVDGWFVVRQTGSHRQLHHPTKTGTVTVAGKPSKTLHPKVLASPYGGKPKSRIREMRYWVRIYQQGKDYSAMAPDLPGCVAAGDSVEDVRELIADAIWLHLDLMRQSGEKVPAPSRHIDLDLTELEDGEMCTWVDVVAHKKPRRKQRVGGG